MQQTETYKHASIKFLSNFCHTSILAGEEKKGGKKKEEKGMDQSSTSEKLISIFTKSKPHLLQAGIKQMHAHLTNSTRIALLGSAKVAI